MFFLTCYNLDIHIFNLQVNTSLLNPPPSTTKQKSLLKPLIRVPLTPGKSVLIRGDLSDKAKSDMKNPQYIPGVKIVRNSLGKLVLVTDKSPTNNKSPLSPGMKVTIKNNKIQSINKSDSKTCTDSSNINNTNKSNNSTHDPSEENRCPQSLIGESNRFKTNVNSSTIRSISPPTIIDLCTEKFEGDTSL